MGVQRVHNPLAGGETEGDGVPLKSRQASVSNALPGRRQK